ncbi:TIR domain-containing protein [Dyella sp. 333MFSha]|uniref:TIR domain-containing protein n=1 Tax=Dyella sp. 333MFSha TaxID=1798240 RepID=UPI000886FE5A|nr:TIR domain-containing protein [Dyella sp. 333MFSha]SDF39466.1 MTH538 TIR-like domain [Dyella sp. 333MFSha]
MSKPDVFYSFHFANDVMRVQLIRNMGVISGDVPVEPNTWEELKRKDKGVEKWIDDQMKDVDAVVVLIGSETSMRPWVKYEIQRALELEKPLLGIYIHNLKSGNEGVSTKGANPLGTVTFKTPAGATVKPPVFEPKASDAYNDIEANIEKWIKAAMAQR